MNSSAQIRSLTIAVSLAALAAPAYAQSHTGHGDSNNQDAPWSQADAYFDPDEMAASRAHVIEHHGGSNAFMMMADRLEVQDHDGEAVGVWDASLWYGGDENKLYVKTEGEFSFEHDEFEDAEIQLLWSRAVSPYFDVQAGLRHDFEPYSLTHAVLGFQGTAPYQLEVDGAAYLSEEGDLTADFEAEYEFLLTQRLILQPRFELGFSAQDVPERELGSGFTSAEAGLRLRYEIIREFAPYIGIEHKTALGETSSLIRSNGGDPSESYLVLGIRAWF